MSTSDDVPVRLRSIRFPAALEWIRVEDVIRVAGGSEGTSKKAFRLRWATRDEFIVDAAVYTLQFADRPDDDEYGPLTERMGALDLRRFGDEIAGLAEDLLAFAESQPRSHLMLHIGTVLHRHPDLQKAFEDAWDPFRENFLAGYTSLLRRLDLRFRPGWTPERFDRALQAIIDGFLLQGRINRDDQEPDAWTHSNLFAETVIAFTIGVLDAERLGLSTRDVITAIGLRPPAAGPG
jgi:hypothetical protein